MDRCFCFLFTAGTERTQTQGRGTTARERGGGHIGLSKWLWEWEQVTAKSQCQPGFWAPAGRQRWSGGGVGGQRGGSEFRRVPWEDRRRLLEHFLGHKLTDSRSQSNIRFIQQKQRLQILSVTRPQDLQSPDGGACFRQKGFKRGRSTDAAWDHVAHMVNWSVIQYISYCIYDVVVEAPFFTMVTCMSIIKLSGFIW